jgi:4-diphosphocytidyl-2-C-methyl-D-erythritol kinase
MNLRRDQLKRTRLAPAKLNLFLEILGRRADGFHELETLMVPIGIFDSLSFESLPSAAGGDAGELILDVRPPVSGYSGQAAEDVPTGAENIVVRALVLLRERSGCLLGAKMELVKRIPAAAGLGGGSSDAAAALRLANDAWGIDWNMERLSELAGEIGSDVPFFLESGAAICRGRGERVSRVRGVRPLHFVIVKPPEGLSTAEVYRAHAELVSGEGRVGVNKAPSPFDKLTAGPCPLPEGEGCSWKSCSGWMRNRLQEAAAVVSPWVDRLRAAFDELDFGGHQLSGSGSAYFGVCRHAQHARRLASVLRSQQLGLVYATRSCA